MAKALRVARALGFPELDLIIPESKTVLQLRQTKLDKDLWNRTGKRVRKLSKSISVSLPDDVDIHEVMEAIWPVLRSRFGMVKKQR